MSDEEDVLAAAAQRVGSVLHGKYHLDRVLGVGGMATVYAATHRNRKPFAVKILHPEFAVRGDVRTRFVREGYVANSVKHPGVVVVLDDDVDETGAPFLVMELLEGVTVEALCASAGGPLPLRESLGIACQLLEVLEAAHEKSVIHRDVKPANIFILNDGQLKVVDFGIARLHEADSGVKSTRAGAMLGTPAFMAPEQARAVPGEIDAGTDIWAVGATLFTMLSAQFVHSGENSRQLMISAATVPARSLGSLAPDLPAAVVDLVTRALMFEKSARWPSARAMREAVLDLHQQLFGEPSPSNLRALLERTSANAGSSPTELSPVIATDPASPEGQPDTDTAPAFATPLKPANRELVTTTSTPVSTGSGRASAVPTRRTRLGLVVAGAVVAASLLFVALRQRPPEPASEGNTAAPAAAALTADPTAAPASVNAPQAASTELPQPSAAPSAAASAERPSGTNEVLPSTPAARTSTNPRTQARAATKPPAAAHAADAAPAAGRAPAPPDNPLKLELQ